MSTQSTAHRPGRRSENRGWRIPLELLEQIQAAAAEDLRSVNSEVIVLCELGLKARAKELERARGAQRIAS
jgi:hypothetical protein